MTAPHILDPAGLLSEALSEASPDMMRHLLQTMINTLLSADADAVVGAEWGKPTPTRSAQRNGYRHRDLDTRVGTVDVAIPKLRSGTYFPEWLLERRKRAESALITVVADCYLAGVSTRRMDKLVKTLGINALSKSQVSRMAADLDEQVEAFRHRPLGEAGPFTFVAADALTMKVREGGRVINAVALIAVGVIQLLARLSYRVPGAANYVATRRVGRGAKTTWKRVAALYFVAFIGGIGGWFSAVPEIDEAPALKMIAGDIPSGVAITVVFAAVLLVSSTLLTQALSVVEQKQLTKSFYFIGAPAAFHTKVAAREVGVPMLVVALLGFGMGSLMGTIMVLVHVNVMDKLVLFGALVVVALIGCVLAVLGTGRLREKVLAQTGRAKD